MFEELFLEKNTEKTSSIYEDGQRTHPITNKIKKQNSKKGRSGGRRTRGRRSRDRGRSWGRSQGIRRRRTTVLSVTTVFTNGKRNFKLFDKLANNCLL
jgi:hypothetical protein